MPNYVFLKLLPNAICTAVHVCFITNWDTFALNMNNQSERCLERQGNNNNTTERQSNTTQLEYVVITYISKPLPLQEAFILLDLIGAANPTFHDMFTETTNLYQRFSRIGMYVYMSCFHTAQGTLLASIASPPSDLNGRFFYIYVTSTAHTVMLYVLLILRAYSPSCQQCVAFN